MTDHPSLAAALAALQAALPRVGKDNLAVVKSDKGSYKYNYADLSDVSAAVLPALAKHGLSFSAKPTLLDDGKFVLEYTLRHVSGESDTGRYPLSPSGTPQQIGSAITYARRYALSAVTGVVPDEDDDGQAASQPVQEPVQIHPAEAARTRLKVMCAENSWSLKRVADRFADQHSTSLREEDDPNVINKFAKSLFAVSDTELKATNGAVT